MAEKHWYTIEGSSIYSLFDFDKDLTKSIAKEDIFISIDFSCCHQTNSPILSIISTNKYQSTLQRLSTPIKFNPEYQQSSKVFPIEE